MADMHDQDTKPVGKTVKPGEGDPPKDGNPSDNGKGGEGGEDDPFPTSWEEVFKHSRFKELNESNQALKAKIAEHEAEKEKAKEAAEEAEAKKLEADQKWQELANKREEKAKTLREENKQLKAQVEAFEEIATADIEARMTNYPEALQNLLKPLLDGKSPIDQLKILQDQSETITALLPSEGDGGEKKKTPRGVPPTPKPGDPKETTEAEKTAYRQKYRQSLRGSM